MVFRKVREIVATVGVPERAQPSNHVSAGAWSSTQSTVNALSRRGVKLSSLAVGSAALLLAAACAPAPAAVPTATKPPAAAPTAAPAKPAAQPTAATAKPTAAPAAAKPTEAPKPAASPAASPSPTIAGVPTLSAQARAEGEAFFTGKTIRIVVPASPGGGFDSMGRLVARYLGKHIPGGPNVIVENQPGGGGVLAANAVFNSAPRDGTVLHVLLEGVLQDQYLGQERVQFDARKFTWLGSTQAQTMICLARSDSGINSIRDLQAGGKLLKVSTVGPGSNLHNLPAVLKSLLDLNIELVPGYPGTSEALLAVERGEVNGVCAPWETLKRGPAAEWIGGANPLAKILLQAGQEKHPELPSDIPLATELTRTTEQRQIIQATTAHLAISKPMAAPPEVPSGRAAVLRAAFMATMQDPEFQAEAERMKIDLDVRPAETVERIISEILSTPPEVVEKIKQIRTGT